MRTKLPAPHQLGPSREARINTRVYAMHVHMGRKGFAPSTHIIIHTYPGQGDRDDPNEPYPGVDYEVTSAPDAEAAQRWFETAFVDTNTAGAEAFTVLEVLPLEPRTSEHARHLTERCMFWSAMER